MSCPRCIGNHGPAPEGVYIDFRGYRWTPPFICFRCGIEVCHMQWAFSRTCGPCDVSNSHTARLRYGIFAGPHAALEPHDPRDPGTLLEGDMLDPADRMKYPVLNPPKPWPPFGHQFGVEEHPAD